MTSWLRGKKGRGICVVDMIGYLSVRGNNMVLIMIVGEVVMWNCGLFGG